MIIDFEGRSWDFDPDLLDVKQATVLYLTYKMTISEWSAGFQAMDQRAYHFAYWLMLQQNGVVKPIADCNPKIVAFMSAYADAAITAAGEAAAAEAEAAADPTAGPPPGPPDGTTGSAVPASPTVTTPVFPVPSPVVTGS